MRATSLRDYDLTDLDLFAHGFPHDVFVLHRRDAPVYWHEPTAHAPDGEGFWSIATHAETIEIVRDPAAFSSETGGSRPYGGTVLNDQPIAGSALNMMDDPRHQRVRLLVQRGFTPRTIGRLERELRRRTRMLLDAVAPKGECDFLVEVAAEVPMQAICVLLGVPEGDRHRVFSWIEHSFDFPDREAFETTDEVARAMAELHAYGVALVARKRAEPADDMLSVVVHAEIPELEPPRLTDEELQLFFTLLFAAGSDTTRNAVAGGLLALLEHPGELARVEADPSLLPAAVEEMVRWTSPAAYNRRTATRGLDFHGHRFGAGDKIVFWEASANRDERVFADSMRFVADRDPNPHVGFGHGIHHCLGANLARLEMRVILEETFDRLSGLALAGAPEFARSNKHNGVRHLPIRFDEQTPR